MRVVWGLLVLVLSLLPKLAQATVVPAASCSNGDITTAIGTAVDGDTVTIPAGSCTWTGDVTMPNTKGLILQGAGTGSTIISTGGFKLKLNTSSARQPIRVTAFTLKKSSGTSWDVQITGTAQNWRLDHLTLDANAVSSGYQVMVGTFDCNTDAFTYGLIDHVSFINRNFVTSVFIEWTRSVLDPVACGDYVWGLTAQRGTAQAVYIEDNTFSDNGAASQVVDCRWGCKYVLRYNTIHNPWISTHSGCTNGGRDPIWQEIYNNTFDDDVNRYGGSQLEMRSTSGVMFGNTFAVTANKYGISIDHERSYRTDCTGPYGGRADGTQIFDENTASQKAWRALGQPGWGQPQASDMSAYTFQGVFVWGNLDNGTLVNMVIANNNPWTSTHLVSAREFFNSAAIASGTLGARPGTCSAGTSNRDVYRSTDENAFNVTLYICSATNTWTKHYEPYTYPHPLQGIVMLPNAPTNLRVTN